MYKIEEVSVDKFHLNQGADVLDVKIPENQRTMWFLWTQLVKSSGYYHTNGPVFKCIRKLWFHQAID